MADSDTLLRVEGLTKAFPGILANEAVSLDVRRGEIHAVIGENGAGKTTLMGMLFGLMRPDSGRIEVEGRTRTFSTPRDAIAAGIAFVQQHYSLVPTLTALDNVVLSQRYGSATPMPRAQIAERIRALSDRHGIRVPLETPIETVSIAEQQRIELMKALLGEPKLLILDEPTALLAAEDVRQLWQVLRDLSARGVSVLLIGHHLEDVLSIAHRITVLRHGRSVATVDAADTSVETLGTMMIGALAAPGEAPAADPVAYNAAELLRLDGVAVAEGARTLVRSVSLSVRAGEIVGIAGVLDSGQVELLEAIAGVRPVARGGIAFDGRPIERRNVRERQRLGIAHIPADRHRDGMVGPMSIEDNLTLTAEDRVARLGVLAPRRMAARARELARRFDIRAAGTGVAAGTLSGGNQQKVILARELAREPRLILCSYPTRGLDFAAARAVHAELRAAAAAGAAVVIASTDLAELMALAGRLLVMQGGQIAGELAAAEASAERIGLLMGGAAA